MNNVTVVPLIGAYPITHMGHVKDLVEFISAFQGPKIIGVSFKTFNWNWIKRASIFQRQMGDLSKDICLTLSSSAGYTLESARSAGKHLNLIVGGDRINFADRLKMGLETGSIHEMGDQKFESITIHTPPDTNRKHGLSGTRMREAIKYGDLETFRLHLGPMFDEDEAFKLMNELQALDIKVKRKH